MGCCIQGSSNLIKNIISYNNLLGSVIIKSEDQIKKDITIDDISPIEKNQDNTPIEHDRDNSPIINDKENSPIEKNEENKDNVNNIDEILNSVSSSDLSDN